jgi:hypothetical protein
LLALRPFDPFDKLRAGKLRAGRLRGAGSVVLFFFVCRFSPRRAKKRHTDEKFAAGKAMFERRTAYVV